jgi:NIMA (never in mitosis gene a)-related kinase
LHECHNRKEGKILHRDLKPSNVFLDSDNNIKLGDFGLSRMLSNESVFAYSHVGTPYYMSPEQIDESNYNEKSDIWSLGCFLYELASLNPPFEATNHLSLAMKIKSGKIARIPTKYSEELMRVINWLMSLDQSMRPTIEDLLNLPSVVILLRYH